MKRYDLLVFDWDGTLMDSTAIIVHAIQAAFADLQQPVPSVREARHVIGLGLQEAIAYLAPGLAESEHKHLAAAYRDHYLARDGEITLFDGVLQHVPDLVAQGYVLAVATGKSRVGLDRVLAASGLRACFTTTRCADECFSKPHPQMLEEIMTDTGIAAHRVLMIGDTTHDLQMAAHAGTHAFAVHYGAHTPEQLATCNPVGTAEAFTDFYAWVVG